MTFRESLSSRKSAVSLKTATGGELGTAAKMEAAMAAQTLRSSPLRSGSVRGGRAALEETLTFTGGAGPPLAVTNQRAALGPAPPPANGRPSLSRAPRAADGGGERAR